MKKRMILIAALCIPLMVALRTEALCDTPEKVREALKAAGEGRFEDARKMLAEARRKNPADPRIIFHLAEIEEDSDKAAWLYQEAESLADSNLASEALFRRAEIYFSRRDYTQSDSLYRRLVESYQESIFIPGALNRMGIIRLKSGNTARALDYFSSSLSVAAEGPTRLYAAAGIMECHVTIGDWDRALNAALAALMEKDDEGALTPRILEVISLSWRHLGNEENANKFIERLLKNYPSSIQAHSFREEGQRLASEGFSAFESIEAIVDSEQTATPSQPAPSGVGEARYSIQAGAFSDRSNALILLKVLRDAGLDPRVDMKTVADKHFFVIQVGLYSSREEADAMVEKVSQVTGMRANVVVSN